eukprot:jgi/Mesvir1/5441/Mv15500-RA.1
MYVIVYEAILKRCCGLLGFATSQAAKALSHTITFGVTLALLTNIAQYVYAHRPTRPECAARGLGFWQRHGPLLLVLASVPLVMADLTRHVLQDSGYWPGGPGRWSSSMYQSDPTSVCCGVGLPAGQACEPEDAAAGAAICHRPRSLGGYGHHHWWDCSAERHSCQCEGHVLCLTPIGWLFTIVCTYSGFACLMAGIFWSLGLFHKLRSQWRLLRLAYGTATARS